MMVNLKEALEEIQSDLVRDRENGIGHLKDVLEANRTAPELKGFKDKQWLSMFETIFRVVAKEKAAYLRAPEGGVKTRAQSRLVLSADALRSAIEATVDRFRQKTLNALIRHIVEMLPTSDSSICEPLGPPYLKALATILAFRPHAEHLLREDWLETTDLCLQSIDALVDDVELASSGSAVNQMSRRANESAAAGQSFANTASQGRIKRSGDWVSRTNALFQSLKCLVLIETSPLLNRAPRILSCVISYLESSSTTTGAVDAVAAIRALLRRTCVDSISLTKETLTSLLPLLSSLWQSKESELRDEILMVLITLEPYIIDMFTTTTGEWILRGFGRLFDTMCDDYFRFEGRERRHLQLAELDLDISTSFPETVMPMQARTFRLSKVTARSEHNWALLHFMALFARLLDDRLASEPAQSPEDTPSSPWKRQKLSTRFSDCLNHCSTAPVPMRIYSIQLMTFIVNQRELNLTETDQILDQLKSQIAHPSAAVSSWALIALAACLGQDTSFAAGRQETWLSVWHAAFRLISSTVHCRTACHMLCALVQTRAIASQHILASFDSMMDTGGADRPATLSDASICLWNCAITYMADEGPAGAFVRCQEQMVRWTASKWIPSNFEMWNYTVQITQECSMKHLIKSYCPCSIMDSESSLDAALPNLRIIGQTWLNSVHGRELQNYLLLQKPTESDPDSRLRRPAEAHQDSVPQSNNPRLESFMIDHLLSELEKTTEPWRLAVEGRTRSATVESCILCFSLVLISKSVVSRTEATQPGRATTLRKTTQQLERLLFGYLSDPQTDESAIDTIMELMMPCLPASPEPWKSENSSSRILSLDFLKRLCLTIDGRRDTDVSRTDEHPFEPDSLDFDDAASPYRQASRLAHTPIGRVIFKSPAESMFHSAVKTYAEYLKADSELGTDSAARRLPSPFVEYLLTLSDVDLLAAGRLMCGERLVSLDFQPQDAERLLEHIAFTYLRDYTWERNESSMLLCLTVLKASAPLWTDDNHVSLADIGKQMYGWFVDKAFGKGLSSPRVQAAISDLLFALLRVDPNYGSGGDRPSVRTIILKILEQGELSVQYNIIQRLPEIFGMYVLSQHELIFQDIQKHLPNNSGWLEGIAVRLLAFCNMASSWDTLLRRCTYHIFEAAGSIEDISGHAARCIRQITVKRHLISPQELFQLFSSQILFSWLGARDISSIPYSIFAYVNLKTLLEDARDEVVSQAIMRGDEETLVQLETILAIPIEKMVSASFSLCVAYAFATDTSNPTPTPSGSQQRPAENRLAGLVGEKAWPGLLSRNFQSILGFFMKRLEQEDQFDKSLSRHMKIYAQAARIFQATRDTDLLDDYLPPSQRPCFRTKFLLDDIERLCRRARRDSRQIWTPSATVHVARMLLDDLKPVLGHLHARRVVRRIRILLCLAGPAALSGYPLRMLLHALRSLLTERQCSTDAIGLYKYLLEHGRQHLQENVQFAAGTFLAIFLELRRFLSLSQESTTQESSHRATLATAQTFKEWLTMYLTSFKPASGVQSVNGRFQAIMKSACPSVVSFTANKHSPGSKLLMQMLAELREKESIISQRYFSLCFDQVIESFEDAKNIGNDVLSDAVDAVSAAPLLWRSFAHVKLDGSYIQWASRALGRSFVHTGRLPKTVIAEMGVFDIGGSSARKQQMTPSRVVIMRFLVELLQSTRLPAVAEAERSIRKILVASASSEVGHFIRNHLPEYLSESLSEDITPLTKTPDVSDEPRLPIQTVIADTHGKAYADWLTDVVICLSTLTPDDAVLCHLAPSLRADSRLCEDAFPYLLHCVLQPEGLHGSVYRSQISSGINDLMESPIELNLEHKRLIIKAVLFLRTQAIPNESNHFERMNWLDIDLNKAAEAAKVCKMYKSSLLLLELEQTSLSQKLRRGSVHNQKLPDDILLSIYREIDEPDCFYGVSRQPTLDTLADRYAFDGVGTEELLLRAAQSDSLLRAQQADLSSTLSGLINSMSRLNMNALTLDFSKGQGAAVANSLISDSMTKAAMRLRQWDFSPSKHNMSDASTLYRAYQSLDKVEVLTSVDDIFEKSIAQIYRRITDVNNAGHTLRSSFATLAALSELQEVFTVRGKSDLDQCIGRFQERQSWMGTGRLEDVSLIMSGRETCFGLVSNNRNLQQLLGLSSKVVHYNEIKGLLESSSIYRRHGALQDALSTAAYMSSLAPASSLLGVRADAAIKLETANVLWDRGELVPAIRILQDLNEQRNLESESISVGKAGLLATLGHHVSEARLEKPDEVMNRYLSRAHKELKDQRTGSEAGQVYHEYATYCHNQLTSNENIAELKRSEHFKQRRLKEVHELETMMKGKLDDHQKARVRSDRNKARKWLEIDRIENERLVETREEFLRQALQNYMLALAASDAHDTDLLRFVALWLEHATDNRANDAVVKVIDSVPSAKFAPLMNQLASRLQDSDSVFQKTMTRLIERVCTDHPYHGIYHIYAGSRTEGGNDPVAISRNAAARNLARVLQKKIALQEIWTAVSQANDLYIKLASYRNEALKGGSKHDMRRFSAPKAVETNVPTLHVPPITLTLETRADLDYSDVPYIVRFSPQMVIAGGLSAPKIVTAVSSDGRRHKQLFKSGGDDLRQDAIMEQVFEQVSDLLRSNKATRQRDLRIRTYKVIPLNGNSGAIEFVQDTLALNDFLKKGHERYHPKDWKWDLCRSKIDAVRSRDLQERVKTYKEITRHFAPVLRHFFFENYEDPDDWFDARLAYTRSTAAISILGHALGLGDRHCQNILLDISTGEVVHIDLGVAFEAGRILAVPEVVPFRLTRDVVDGFGIAGIEGVFRRCCEFTLEALRINRDAIMTLLNVLRYDPLYSWTMSPLRAKRLQQEQDRDEAPQGTAGQSMVAKSVRGDEADDDFRGRAPKQQDASDDESHGGEADRALAVVERKLASGLSAMATVNELIQQATDERNLAVLFAGWAAYA